jgi:hypothetical protein
MPLLKANAGKLGLLAGLVVVAVGAYLVRGSRTPTRRSKVQYVCIATGETFWLARGTCKILPATNPKSGEKTLVPCHKREDGRLQVSSRCRGLIRRLERDAVNKLVDPETLLVGAIP